MLFHQCVFLVAASIKVSSHVGDQSVVVWEKPLNRKSTSYWEIGLSAPEVETVLALGGFVKEGINFHGEQRWCFNICSEAKDCQNHLYSWWIKRYRQLGALDFIYNINEKVIYESRKVGSSPRRFRTLFKALGPEKKKELLLRRVTRAHKVIESWRAISEERRNQVYNDATFKTSFHLCMKMWGSEGLKFNEECDKEMLIQSIDAGYISLTGINSCLSTFENSRLKLPMPDGMELSLSRNHYYYQGISKRYTFIAWRGKVYNFQFTLEGEAIGSFIDGGQHANSFENDIGYDDILSLKSPESNAIKTIYKNSKITIAGDHH